MSKLHIIGIGGTGHKVLSAAIHLAACGAFKGRLGANEITGISVLTIDADDSNGNLSQTKNTLAAYRSYYDALNGANKLGLVNIEPVSEDINISLYMDDKKSISKTFNIPQYAGSDDDRLIRFLYTDNEINAEFDQGFYGHTSVGTLIVKDLLKSSEVWVKQLSNINENDFVVVIGSLFGGTGASAIPVLLDELKSKQMATTFKLAALVLNPYFKTAGKIQEEGLLQPDSASFNIKTKASLYYYYSQKQYEKTDALYIIGENEANFSVEAASRGAADQRNKASPIELFAATVLIDFVKESDNRKDGKIITASRSEKDGVCCWTWDMLQESLPDLSQYIKDTVKMAVFYNKVLYGELKDGGAAGAFQNYYDKDINERRDEKQNLIYENIHNYLKLLAGWFYDIHKRNKTEVNPNTGNLMWEADARAKLFNANYANLFDDVQIKGSKIENFERLVYGDIRGKKSEKIYAEICAGKHSGKHTKGFAALFDALYMIVHEQEKGFALFGLKPPEPENFTRIPYLSRENDVTFKRPDDVNKLWVKSETGILTDIANGLPAGVSESFTKNDIAVPSPWSIFIMNELTLAEPKFKSINKGAFKEWCGIIALLALRKANLYERAGLKLEELKLGGGDGEFLRVVDSTSKPGSAIFDNPNWIKCHRLSLDGVTVAFLAHNTFVCPAYSLDNATKAKLNIIAPSIVDESGDFQHPANYFADQNQSLNRDAKYALKLFLTELKTIVTREAGKNSGDIMGRMQNLIDDYIKAIGSVKPNNNLAIDPEKKDVIHSVVSVFEELCITPNKANAELPFIMHGTKISAALIGTNICGVSSSGPEAAHFLVTKDIVYNQITQATINEYRNKMYDGIKLFYDEDLLLDSMIMIKKDGAQVFNALPNSSSLPDYEIIWPLNSVLLELYGPDELNKMVSLSADSEKITVSIKIKLSGKPGSPLVSHTVSKEYTIKNLSDIPDDDTRMHGICSIMEKNLIPFWSVWPYAIINGADGNSIWKRYNFFCIEPNYRGIPVLDMTPVFSGSGGFSIDEQSRKLSTLQTFTHEFYYKRYTELPIAFKASEKTDGAPIDRGLVFLRKPEPVNASTARWNIGIDFGTTSTTAFYTTATDPMPKFIQLMSEYHWKEGSDRPDKNEYSNGVVTICDNGDKSSEYYFIDRHCLEQNGYTTALEPMGTDILADGADPTIFTSERIFWHNYENFRLMNTQKGRKEGLLTNIKWDGSKSNSAKYLNQLLTQIVYQAAANGVRDIGLFFSYPTSFGLSATAEFFDRIGRIISRLSEDTGITLRFDEKDNFLTESIAAAYYFNHKKPLETMFFCVDIGGGSTDVSIWIKTKHLFQTSIHFASRDMFIRPLTRILHIDSVLDAVRTKNIADGIYTMLSDDPKNKEMTDDKYKFLIETVLFEYYYPLSTRLQDMTGHDAEAFKIFKYCVLIAYSGLIYYLANIIAALLTIPDKERRIDNDIKEIILGLSGKGSKLTSWIKPYCDIVYGEISNLIKEKTQLSIKISPEFSPDAAKTETAKGLICNLDETGKQKKQVTIRSPEVYMGCDIRVKKENEVNTLHGGDFVDVHNDQFFYSPKELKIEFDKELCELDAFIEFFNRITAKTGKDMPPINMKTYKASKPALWKKIQQGAENVLDEDRFEPPFILMLKVFMEEYVEDLWENLN
jgi:hypothetical protein